VSLKPTLLVLFLFMVLTIGVACATPAESPDQAVLTEGAPRSLKQHQEETTTTTTVPPTTTTAPPPPPPTTTTTTAQAVEVEVDVEVDVPVSNGDPYVDASWHQLAECESTGIWSLNTGNGYYGGIQFSLGSWQGVGGSGLPSDASVAEQIQRGRMLWEQGGWAHWPACTASFGWR